MATYSVKVDREPIGTVSAPCDEKVWRDMEAQAKADGWDDLAWGHCGSYHTLYGSYHTLYGRRAVLVKTEPTRPAWLNDDARYASLWPVRDRDGVPRIRSELGGLMGPGYQATGYEPPPRRKVLLDDPTGDDIAGDVP